MNNKIATGHLMRCLSIADAAKQCGEATTFLLADEQAVEILRSRGHQFIVLHTQWNDMDAELQAIENVISERKIDKILIDSYQVTENYLKQLTEWVTTFYIDDLNAFIYPVDAIICYANYWEKFDYFSHYPDKKLFLGTQYAPLRAEFSNCSPKQMKSKAENLLLLSGGTDHFDMLDRLLQRIDKEQYRWIDVICGTYYSKYEMICQKYSAYTNIRIHMSVTDMKDYMEQADLAVTAGGTTLYELCAVGTPTISYSIADNQLENVKKFQEDGLVDYAGDVRFDDVMEHIIGYLKEYYDNKRLRQERSIKMQKLVDGKGARRIAEILKETLF